MNTHEYAESAMCKKCGGACCKQMGCHYSPSDFSEITYESLMAEIKKGHISIDWWEGECDEYFLRIRNVERQVVDPSWGGTCSLLSKNGCVLKFEDRPLGARALEPKRDRYGFQCVQHYTKEDCKNEWAAHNNILAALKSYFESEGSCVHA